MSETPILLIDDDRDLTDLLVDYLGAEGFTVEVAHDGKAGLDQASSIAPALIVCDVMMPVMNGFDVLRALRARNNKTPVLMLTARGDDVDRIVGLELGADDYLAKPFNARELVARIRAILRRAGETAATSAASAAPGGAVDGRSTVIADVELYPGSMTVRRAGEDLSLTSAEFGFLEVLMQHAGTVVSREALCEKVLGRRLSAWDRSIDVHMSNLRKKLGKDAAGRDRIKTVRGVGYLYATDAGGAQG